MAKIGLSYSRCVRDIVEGKVSIDEVFVIVSSTNFDPTSDAQWNKVWYGYGADGGDADSWALPEWEAFDSSHEDMFRDVSIRLWNEGKLHQPRKFGALPHRLPYTWLDLTVPPEDLDKRPAVKSAWEQYQILLGLSGLIEKDLLC